MSKFLHPKKKGDGQSRLEPSTDSARKSVQTVASLLAPDVVLGPPTTSTLKNNPTDRQVIDEPYLDPIKVKYYMTQWFPDEKWHAKHKLGVWYFDVPKGKQLDKKQLETMKK